MVNKRGLSPNEFEHLPPDVLEVLMVYDKFIEPSGLAVEMQKYANLCHLIMMTSPNLSETGRRDAKVKDWDLFGTFENLTYLERVEKLEKEQNESKRNAARKAFGELIKNENLGNKDNGKQ